MASTPVLADHSHHAPPLPRGRTVELAGRGATFVHEATGPVGSPTLMLLHGLGATAALNWYTSFPVLEHEFHVVAPDHRGHGRGSRMRSPFTLEDAADDVVALADALGVERFVAVGYSMGGPIAQLIWHRHPERVAGLVLCATSYRFRVTPPEHVMYAWLPAITHASRVVPEAARRFVITQLSAPYLSQCEYPTWARQELLRPDRRVVLQAAAALGNYSARRWIADIDVPTSVLVHRRDQLVPPRRQLELASAIDGARMHVVDSDHFSPVRSPAPFLRSLVAGIKDVVHADEAPVAMLRAS
jgi:3-oxoadipate enol-lactonase